MQGEGLLAADADARLHKRAVLVPITCSTHPCPYELPAAPIDLRETLERAMCISRGQRANAFFNTL